MRKRPRLWLATIGAAGGLALGLGYWLAWGCRNCAEDGSPVAIVTFCAVVGALMARSWGMDHLQPPS